MAHQHLSPSGEILQPMKSSLVAEKGSLYLFPITTTNKELPMKTSFSHVNKGHFRSASHSGVESSTTSPTYTRPSALKKGHQRAFSQGQIIDSNELLLNHPPLRTPSKTDFILPASHRDIDSDYNVYDQRHKGHSRQASRSDSTYTLRQTNATVPWKQYFWCFSRQKPTIDDSRIRTITPSITVTSTTKNMKNKGQCHNNRICTTKYTLLSFLPKNLLEQFHRFANLYFILIVLLNWVPSINAFGKEIAMIPVLFVLGVTAVKDLFEDRRRYASDKRINNSECNVYNREEGCYKVMLWQDIRPGDIIKLENNDVIPADVLVLKCSDSRGLCYIDTCNLDGESNLKQRQVVSCFMDKRRPFMPQHFSSKIEVDSPTTKIYKFQGAIVHSNGEKIPVNTDNLLLRECILKNTDSIEGIVVYAGHETKAMLNSNGPRYKMSTLEKRMNKDILWCVVILMVLCCVGTFVAYLWHEQYNTLKVVPFMEARDLEGFSFLPTFCRFIIILQVMIPLSLYVTVEMSKLLQVYHIHQNTELHDNEYNKKIECRALNITEELGQVEYIFSDKTGTLTENKMLFRRCTIDGIDYDHKTPVSIFNNDGNNSPKLNQQLIEYLSNAEVNDISENDMLLSSTGDASNLFSNNLSFSIQTMHAKRVQEFMLVLALCNTVVISSHSHKNELEECDSEVTESDINESSISTNEPNILSPIGLSLKNQPSKFQRIRRLMMPSNRGLDQSDDTGQIQDFCVTEDTSPIRNGRVLSSAESSPSSSSTLRQRLKKFGPSFQPIPILMRRFRNKGSKTRVINTPNVVKPIFEAESPDELALVETAYAYNVRLIKRSPFSASIIMPGNNVFDFDVLKILPFDSTRKCMSVIVQHPETKEIIVYCKGADSTILPLLSQNEYTNNHGFIYTTQQHLNGYAKQGLRTLVMAKRVLSEMEYTEWADRYNEAECSFNDRDKKLFKSYAEIERDLTLMGATGIEDRLQENVPGTIQALRLAGIIIWVLTGDKTETAINVAYSSKLFSPQMEIIKITAKSKSEAEYLISKHLQEIVELSQIQDESDNSGISTKSDSGLLSFLPILNKSKLKWPFIQKHGQTINMSHKRRALVVDGKTLTFILDRRSKLVTPFLELTKHCTSVLCCRATPLQKAFLVRVVKKELHMRTLAIGDGANDVSMIQAADVGIGISGQEGMQAVMASDFALSRFKFLERLLLVHGHWNYDRLANMVLYCFYKNAIFVFLIFWYQFYCGFSGAVMIDQVYLMLYNLFFTSLPPLVIGVYDQDAPEDLLLSHPYLYAIGRKSAIYKSYSFWLTIIDAFYQSLVLFFFAYWHYNESDIGIWEFGMTVCTSCMFAMIVQGCMETRSWSIIHWISLLISIGSYYLFTFVYNYIGNRIMSSNVWVMESTLYRLDYWLLTIISTVFALLPRFALIVLRNTLIPDVVISAVTAMRWRERGNENFIISWYETIFSASRTRVINTTKIQMKEKPQILTIIG